MIDRVSIPARTVRQNARGPGFVLAAPAQVAEYNRRRGWARARSMSVLTSRLPGGVDRIAVQVHRERHARSGSRGI